VSGTEDKKFRAATSRPEARLESSAAANNKKQRKRKAKKKAAEAGESLAKE